MSVNIEYQGLDYDSWEDVFEAAIGHHFCMEVFSYNSEVTDAFWSTLELVARDRLCALEIARVNGLDVVFVEFILYVICNNNQAEYGTSPRCCWLTEKGENTFKELCSIRDKI